MRDCKTKSLPLLAKKFDITRQQTHRAQKGVIDARATGAQEEEAFRAAGLGAQRAEKEKEEEEEEQSFV